MFPYSFGFALQESVVKIEFVPQEIQYGAKFGEKYQKIGNFFFIIFFRDKRVLGLNSNYNQR